MLKILVLTFSLSASERIESLKTFQKEGYRPFEYSQNLHLRATQPPYGRGELEWPVEFQSPLYALGNSMIHFQKYGDGAAYFHGGCDVRAQAGSWVKAPVSGKLEAGEYGYTVDKNGGLIKQWKPWPIREDSLYFEIAVVDDNGFRFEIHHVLRSTIPPEVEVILDQNGRVMKGQALAKVATWPEEKPNGANYHHIHYNIISSSGIRLNPEYFSSSIADSIAPVIKRSFFIDQNNKAREFFSRDTINSPREIVLLTEDYLDQNFYSHPPVHTVLEINGAKEFEWDFRMTLTSTLGLFPSLFQFYRNTLNLEDEQLKTKGNYSQDVFLIRIPVNKDKTGPFEIKVYDSRGNESTLSGTIQR